MIDRWTYIRRRACEVLNRYASKTGHAPFGDQGGSHLVLREIAEFGFNEFYLDLEDDMLPVNVAGQLSHHERSISVHANVEAIRKAFIAAHEMGHLALEHPEREFRDAEMDEQPHAGSLSQNDKVPRAYRPRDRWELEANVFAAELLAPLHEVRRYIREHRDWEIKSMANYFGLSKDAMRNQLVSAFIACPRPDFTERSTGANSQPSQLPNYLHLDSEQEEAASIKAPALILAGPGAGKTRVLTARFARLVNHDNVEPNRILALTFSNKAVAEMRERLYEAFPDKEHEVQVFTFHSLGLELLGGYGGFAEAPIVLTDADVFVLLRSRLHLLPLGGFHNFTNPTLLLNDIRERINQLKERGITPQEFENRVLKWQAQLEQQVCDIEAERESLKKQKTIASKCLDLAAIYAQYQEWLAEEGYVDYPELINQALRLFQDPVIAQSICEQYDHILVDEFQDINLACGQLVKALNDDKNKIWAVADPRQSIYGFRGASLRHLARFQDDYKSARVITLGTNYRSASEIVELSSAIPFPEVANPIFNVSALKSHRDSSSLNPAIHILQAKPQAARATTTAVEIAELVANVKEVARTVPREEIAVLCRTGYLARDICEALECEGVPTNWSGQLEEQEAFKDLMSVLLLADNRPLALMRLAKKDEHYLSDEDLRLITHEAAQQQNQLYRALSVAYKGQIAGLSSEGQAVAGTLRKLAGRLHQCPNAWNALSVYLFEETRWLRDVLEDENPQARRYLATISQVLDLAREFAFKGKISGQSDTRAFLDYMFSTRETGSLPCSDSTPVIADAVQVLTIHKSKGLEWPVVFIPSWDFTPWVKTKPLPLPEHLLGEEAFVDEEEFGRACLAYVAVTRAKDQLWISHSVPLPTFLSTLTQTLGEKIEKRITVRPPWKRVYPPRIHSPFRASVIPYSMIRQYGYCPKRAQYDYVYGLRTESSGYSFFVRRMRVALQWILECHEKGLMPNAGEISNYINELWQQDRKPERRLSPFYHEQALQCARTFAARIQSGVTIQLLREWELPLANGKPDEELFIGFKTDEWIEGDEQDGVITRAVLHRYDAPSEQHLNDPLLALYLTIGNQNRDIEVRLHYLADGKEKTIIVDSQSDVFVKARQQMKERARAIRNGVFPTTQNKKSLCPRCPYSLICPT